MNEAKEIEQFLSSLAMRLVAGSRDYGDASFGRELDATVNEIDQELVDTVGWLFVLWGQLAIRSGSKMRGGALRGAFLDNLGRRLRSADTTPAAPGTQYLGGCRSRIEILAAGAFEWRMSVRLLLAEILAQIEPEERQALDDQYRARRGSTRDPRTDD